jgi:hypothetical protein
MAALWPVENDDPLWGFILNDDPLWGFISPHGYKCIHIKNHSKVNRLIPCSLDVLIPSNSLRIVANAEKAEPQPQWFGFFCPKKDSNSYVQSLHRNSGMGIM